MGGDRRGFLCELSSTCPLMLRRIGGTNRNDTGARTAPPTLHRKRRLHNLHLGLAHCSWTHHASTRRSAPAHHDHQHNASLLRLPPNLPHAGNDIQSQQRTCWRFDTKNNSTKSLHEQSTPTSPPRSFLKAENHVDTPLSRNTLRPTHHPARLPLPRQRLGNRSQSLHDPNQHAHLPLPLSNRRIIHPTIRARHFRIFGLPSRFRLFGAIQRYYGLVEKIYILTRCVTSWNGTGSHGLTRLRRLRG